MIVSPYRLTILDASAYDPTPGERGCMLGIAHLSMSLIVGLLALVLLSTPAASQSVPQLWKARALEAGEKLQALRRKLEQFRDRWNSQEANDLKCESLLESAFALHLTHESIAHKILKSDRHAFKIVLNGGDQGLFDLTYMYDPPNWTLVSMEILALPRAWEVIHPRELKSAGGVMLLVRDKADADPRCVFGFSQDDPFLAHVVRSSK
jgi:hypothetical protein